MKVIQQLWKKQILKLLIDNDINLNLQNNFGKTALMLCIKNWSENEKINFDIIINSTKNLNIRDNYGDTSLIIVVLENKEYFVQQLIEKNADLDIQDDVGDTPLIMAVKDQFDFNNKNIIKLLVNAYIYIQNNNGNTALDLSKLEFKSILIERKELLKYNIKMELKKFL